MGCCSQSLPGPVTPLSDAVRMQAKGMSVSRATASCNGLASLPTLPVPAYLACWWAVIGQCGPVRKCTTWPIQQLVMYLSMLVVNRSCTLILFPGPVACRSQSFPPSYIHTREPLGPHRPPYELRRARRSHSLSCFLVRSRLALTLTLYYQPRPLCVSQTTSLTNLRCVFSFNPFRFTSYASIYILSS